MTHLPTSISIIAHMVDEFGENFEFSGVFVWKEWTFLCVLLGVTMLIGGIGALLPKDLTWDPPHIVVSDRKGQPLATLPEMHHIQTEELPQAFVNLLLWREDRDFLTHPGVSLKATAGALWQSLLARAWVRGGSTLTQQVVKRRRGLSRNTPLSKLSEIMLAIGIDMKFTKEEILLAYANSVFLGSGIYGFETGARAYFNKGLAHLHLKERLALLELSRAPSALSPYRHLDRLKNRVDQLLKLYYQKGLISQVSYQYAQEKDLTFSALPNRWIAPHFVLRVLSEAERLVAREQIRHIRTTLDRDSYTNALSEARQAVSLRRLQGLQNIGLVLIDHTSGDVLVYMGSTDFFGEKGQHDALRVPRQMGSTMKPFTYALAMEQQEITAATLLKDEYSTYQALYGDYVPMNYNHHFRGDVRAAEALGSSLNVPAVGLLHRIGQESLYHYLRASVHMDSLVEGPDFYGLGLTLGNANISLMDLTRAYLPFAAEGAWFQPRMIQSITLKDGTQIQIPKPTRHKVLSPETAYLITHILSTEHYRATSFGVDTPLVLPFQAAVKTGTSQDFRDNVIVGYSARYLLGIWGGNFDAEPMEHMPSVVGLGDLWQGLLVQAEQRAPAGRPFSRQTLRLNMRRICALSGLLATENCLQVVDELFLQGTEPSRLCDMHGSHLQAALGAPSVDDAMPFRIHYPQEGSVFRYTELLRPEDQGLVLRARGVPTDANSQPFPVYWKVNGEPLGEGKELVWQLQPGIWHFEATSSQEHVQVSIRVEPS